MISGFTLWLGPPPHSNRVATATRHVTDNAMRKSDFITATNPRLLLLAGMIGAQKALFGSLISWVFLSPRFGQGRCSFPVRPLSPDFNLQNRLTQILVVNNRDIPELRRLLLELVRVHPIPERACPGGISRSLAHPTGRYHSSYEYAGQPLATIVFFWVARISKSLAEASGTLPSRDFTIDHRAEIVGDKQVVSCDICTRARRSRRRVGIRRVLPLYVRRL